MEENNHEQLEKILNSISQDAKPDKNFEQMLKVKLRERFHEQYETPKIPFFQRIWKFKTQLTTTFVLVIFSSTTIYAYGSDSVTNGSILYPLKISTEKVEETFATTPEAKSNYYKKMAQRRMRELAVLERKGVIDEKTIKETDNLIVRASTIALAVPEEEIDEMIEVKTVKKTRNPAPTRIELPVAAPSSTPIQLMKEIPAATTVDVREDNTPEIAEMKAKEEEIVETEVTTRKKTKREKAIEEISEVRAEFDDKFYKRTKQNIREEKIEDKKEEERETPEFKRIDPETIKTLEIRDTIR